MVVAQRIGTPYTILKKNMKSLIFITATFFYFISSAVEGQAYHPLIKSNKFWTLMDLDPTALCYTTGGRQQYFFGDTIIQNITYQKIASCGVISLCQCGLFCQPFAVDTTGNCANGGSISSSQFMREDTLIRKVYLLDLAIDTVEHLLFDFSLNVGDTFSTPFTTQGPNTLTVDSIGQYPLITGYGKIFYLHDGNSYIESIGDVGGLTNILVLQIGGPATNLSCVKDDGNYIYSTSSGDCFGVVGLNDNSNSDMPFTIHQVGNSIKVNINDKQQVALLQLFDSSGRIVYSSVILNSESSISLDGFQSGLYLYCLSQGLQNLRGKIILN